VPDPLDVSRLEGVAGKLRSNIVRVTAMAGSSHNGGSLSAVGVFGLK